ncbi:hypothetical protein P3S67_028290 [Capsicum chacoense]
MRPPSIVSEKTAFPNLGSVRGYGLIDEATRELEKNMSRSCIMCYITCSCCYGCIHSVNWAAHQLTVQLGKKEIPPTLKSHPWQKLISLFHFLHPLDRRFRSAFANKGLSTMDMVALSDHIHRHRAGFAYT